MNYIAVILVLLVCGSSLALAQTAGASSGSSTASGTATADSTGCAGGTLSTGHAISGTEGPSAPNPRNAIGNGAAGSDPDASAVTQAPTSHDNAVSTPAAND